MAPPKRGRPRTTTAPTPNDEAATPETNKKRTAPHRTTQTPMEMAAEEEVYKIDRITNTKWLKGERMYLVLWEGYSEKEST